MWLLNTARAELKFFPTPESVPGGYAILSHVWDEGEQTFQDLQTLRTRLTEYGINPRDHVCDKIRQFCIVAERCGHEWGWADMCCIDKTSSTELSEAITSMYWYYSLAEVCYVYLHDVPTASEDDLRAYSSVFRNSRWHKRGWTLQELIAPPFVVFLSETWDVLGAKADLADLLQEITRVPVNVLKLEAHPSAYCVAARMSWAAGRQTTRPEDEAYCLMGIFGIFMPPMYGEGRNAFLRLQEEIMRQVDDPSLFAWGCVQAPRNPSFTPISAYEPVMPREAFIKRIEATALFAHSPSDFKEGHLITCRSGRLRSQTTLLETPEIWKPADMSKLPTFTLTPYGVKAYLPVFPVAGVDIILALLWGIEARTWDNDTMDLGLALRRMESPDDTRPLYVPFLFHSYRMFTSLEALSHLQQTEVLEAEIRSLEWREIYIVRGDAPAMDPANGLQTVSASLLAPFYFPRSSITEFLRQSWIKSYALHPPNPTDHSWREPYGVALEVKFKDDLRPWVGFVTESKVTAFVIYLGLCTKASSDHPQHWAKIVECEDTEMDKLAERIPKIEHSCAEHHVDKCPTQVNRLNWKWGYWRLQLSFKPHVLSPKLCRKVDMKWLDYY